jgi:hypothetical protein
MNNQHVLTAPVVNTRQQSTTPLDLIKRQGAPAGLIEGAELLSENEWADVIKYQKELDDEQIEKERYLKQV